MQPFMQRFDDWSASFLSHRLSMFAGMTADLDLNRIERGDARGHLDCNWRCRRCMVLQEVASRVSTATLQTDRLIGTIPDPAGE